MLRLSLIAVLLQIFAACYAQTHTGTNVALAANGGTCTTTVIDPEHPCENALDGYHTTTSANYKFDTLTDITDKYLEIQFDAMYIVVSMRIMESYWGDEKNVKDVTVVFSDGSSETITLTSRANGYIWEDFYFNATATSSVKLIFGPTYLGSYTSIAEVEIYGTEAPTTTTTTTTTTEPLRPEDNVAATSNGATCASSFASDDGDERHPCSGAIDGTWETFNTLYRWDFTGAPIGVWIQIDFDGAYKMYLMRIVEVYFGDEKNIKDLELAFSDGSTQTVTLVERQDGLIWEEFDIDAVVTSSVKATIMSSYDGTYTAITEIEFYGEKVEPTTTTMRPRPTRTPIGTNSPPTALPTTPQPDCRPVVYDFDNEEEFGLTTPNRFALQEPNEILDGSGDSRRFGMFFQRTLELSLVIQPDNPAAILPVVVRRICVATVNVAEVNFVFYNAREEPIDTYGSEVQRDYCYEFDPVVGVRGIALTFTKSFARLYVELEDLKIEACQLRPVPF